MKKIYIIHGWSGSPEEPMLKWLTEELRKQGFEVVAPEMPDTDEPKIEKWVSFISELVGVPNQNTFFIGHSIGCQAILRFLETLPEGIQIGGAVFIAGWYNVRNLETDEEKQIVGPWVNTPRNDAKIKRALNQAVVILSDNDKWVALENQDAWREKVGARVITQENKGHFTEDDGVTELPIALTEILKMIGS